MDEQQLARALGWLSLGLGVSLLLAPDSMAQAIGVRDDGGTRTVLRVIGLREIASGIGILTQDRPVEWLWARVAGDAMDLTLLGSAITTGKAQPDRAAVATASLVGVTALDTLCSERWTRRFVEAA